MKLSLAITTMNRFSMTVASFEKVIDDPRIDDIVLLDDCSTDDSYRLLKQYFKDNEKVRIIRQAKNRGMSQNKADAISYCKQDHVIIFDSDNTLDKGYLDALEAVGELTYDTIYCPDFPRPNFVYGKFSGQTFNRNNIKELVSDDMGNCCANTANYVVPREMYGKVYRHNPEMKASDTIWMAYLWLKEGFKLHIVKGMAYDHLVWSGSGFMEEATYNMKKAAEVKQLILSL
jgi:glycosyltransferase involved in cell wall biosynthesis